MFIIEAIIQSLFSHFYIVSFIAGLLGEEAVLFLTFLASINGMHLPAILILAPIGIWVIDIVYFHVGRIRLLREASKKIKKLEECNGLLPKIIRFSNRHPLCALIATKFIYATRISLVIYLSTQKFRLRRFLFYNFIAIEIWALVMITLTWLAGRGLVTGLHIAKDFILIVVLALGFVILFDSIIRLGYYLFKKRPINLR